MRIVYVCNEYPPSTHGGIGVVVKSLAEALVERGHEVTVIGYDPLVKEKSERDEQGVHVIRIPIESYYQLRVGRFTLSMEPILHRKALSDQLEKTIKAFKPDLVESFDWSGPLWKKPSVKLVVRMHGANTAHQFYERKPPSNLLYFFEKRNISFADALCAVSNHIGNLTLESLDLKDKPFICLYNFVDTDRFKPLPGIDKDPNKLLYFGRIHPRKGLSELFQILKVLFNINTDARLELAGPYSNEYREELMKFLPVTQRHRVIFLGKLSHEELPRLINSAALFVMPSRAEAFGLTAIEAMACGTPVLMTDKASGPEIIQDGKTGWLFSIEKANESAEKINQLIKNGALLRQVGENAIKHVLNNFSKNVVFEKNLIFYRNVIQ